MAMILQIQCVLLALMLTIFAACGSTSSSFETEKPTPWSVEEPTEQLNEDIDDKLQRPVIEWTRNPDLCYRFPFQITFNTKFQFTEGQPLDIHFVSPTDEETFYSIQIPLDKFDIYGSLYPQSWGYKNVTKEGYLSIWLDRHDPSTYMGFDNDIVYSFGISLYDRESGPPRTAIRFHPIIKVCQNNHCILSRENSDFWIEKYPGYACYYWSAKA